MIDMRIRRFAWVFILAGVCLSVGLLRSHSRGSQRSVAGIQDPVQTETTGQRELFVDGYQLTVNYLYTYDISALVVSTHNYNSSNVGDKLAPKDVALAWGPVAAYNTNVDFHWKQSGRWYYWKVNTYEELEPVGDVAAVSSHSANNHLIGADETVKKQIKRIKTGDYIRLTGYLVNVEGKKEDGHTFQWRSSTSRSDTGAGACELIYVTGVEWLD